MTTRPEALRLADEIDPLTRYALDNLTYSAAAAELRRLHNEILCYHDDRLKLSNEVDRLRAALGLIASLGPRPAAWCGLTDEEVFRVWLSPETGKIPHCDRYLHYYRAIEAKLKEKNNG